MLRPRRNIAIKVPLYRHEDTVDFYPDCVRRPVARTVANSFGSGELTLRIDRVPQQSQPDAWLERFSYFSTKALARLGSSQRDDLDPLDGVTGPWMSDFAWVGLLVHKSQSEPDAEREG